MTGPRKSQRHPRAAGAKQACPRTKGCGRARLAGESCMVVRSRRSISSQSHWAGEKGPWARRPRKRGEGGAAQAPAPSVQAPA
eukprot:3686043-Pleurochrysis_carterae.AAC.1